MLYDVKENSINMTNENKAKKQHTEDETTDDLRVARYEPLVQPMKLVEEIPSTKESRETVRKGRLQAASCLKGTDDRLLVIVGPCSIHDVDLALDYAKRLKEVATELQNDLVVLMRCYFEKPRTTVGWKGLINDPDIDNSFNINKGLHVARKLLRSLTEMGIPVAAELLDTITPQFIGEFISWGAIGARTTESQLHRELASGLSFPVGFKNGTDGSSTVAINAIQSACHQHHFIGVNKEGDVAITNTKGNDLCHLILRGGKIGPNYDHAAVVKACSDLKKAGLDEKVMIDFSHGNSHKKHKEQLLVCSDVSRQIAEGDNSIFGIMIESNIEEGNQKIPPTGRKDLKYGVSITDACVNFPDTVTMLNQLAEAVRERRKINASK